MAYVVRRTTNPQADAKHNYLAGGVCAINPKSFHHVADDIYVFECESIEAQHDS